MFVVVSLGVLDARWKENDDRRLDVGVLGEMVDLLRLSERRVVRGVKSELDVGCGDVVVAMFPSLSLLSFSPIPR